ncbi:MAG TPA: glycosyltransferase [Gemmatimonadaceae bacterium]|nr:glycosyltransferase [Gemmatimonadaceae bacterium]
MPRSQASNPLPGTELSHRSSRSPEQLRVAFCIDNMNAGGTELNAFRTALRLLEHGLHLRVLCLAVEGPLLQRYSDAGIPVHFLPIEKLYGRKAFRYGRELAATIRREDIHVLHAHDFYSNIFAAPWVRLAGAAFVASRRWWEGPDRRLQRFANRASYLFAHRVLANSEAVARLLSDAEKVRPGRIAVIRNFLDEQAFDDPTESWIRQTKHVLRLTSDAPIIGSVGSLSTLKDNAGLLHAAAQIHGEFPALRIVLVGRDAGTRTELEVLAASLGLRDAVVFAGEMRSIRLRTTSLMYRCSHQSPRACRTASSKRWPRPALWSPRASGPCRMRCWMA